MLLQSMRLGSAPNKALLAIGDVAERALPISAIRVRCRTHFLGTRLTHLQQLLQRVTFADISSQLYRWPTRPGVRYPSNNKCEVCLL